MADFDYGKWKVSPGLMNEDRFGHDDRWLSFKIGAITVAPYVEHQEGLLDPYAPDTVHGTRLTIPLFGGLSLHARAFYIKPTQLPRGVSIDQPGEYVAFPSQSSREWRVTGEAHGFSFGPTWTW